MKRVRRIDFSGKIRLRKPGEAKRDDELTATPTANGFLRVEGRIMRDGSLEYSDGQSTWREFRSPQEVDKSLDSFRNVVLTLGHPEDMVSRENVRDVDQGHLGSALRRDEKLPDHIRADMLVTGKDALDAIARGVAELSVGFTAMVVPQSGVDSKGQPYSFVQTDIEGNHVAIVDEGRAGPDARLLVDGKASKTAEGAPMVAFATRTDSPKQRPLFDQESEMETVDIEIDGQTVTVPKAAADLIAAQAAKIEQMGEEPEEEPEEDSPPSSHQTPGADSLAKLQAKCDAQEAQLATLLADKATRSRKALLATASRLGVKLDAKKLETDQDIMRAVVLARLPALEPKLDEHAEQPGYLRALFDQVVDTAEVELSHSITDAVNRAALGDDADVFEFRDHMDDLVKREGDESEAV